MILCHILAFITVLTTFLRHQAIMDLPFLTTNIYHGTYFSSFLILACLDIRRIKIRFIWLPFYIAAILSIVSGDPSPIFQPWERLAAFCMISLAIGPLLDSPRLNVFRLRLFFYMIVLILITCLSSFIIWGMKISLVQDRNGLLLGIFNSSMTFSPLACILVLNFIRPLLLKKPSVAMKFSFAVLIVIFFLLIFLSASRSALIALLLAALLQIFLVFRKNLITFFIILFVIILAAGISFPNWNSYLENMEKKMDRDQIENPNNVFHSRERLWSIRMLEFKQNPIFGTGFASADLTISQGHLSFETGVIEPGSSWLFLLSSTGIFGFLCFLFPLLKIIIELLKGLPSAHSAAIPYCISSLVFFMIHFVAEGYMLASGGLLFSLFWIHIYISDNQINIRKENSASIDGSSPNWKSIMFPQYS